MMLTDTEDDFFFEEDKIGPPEHGLAEAEVEANSPEDSASPSEIHVAVFGSIAIAGECLGRYGEFEKQKYELDRLGMTVTTNSVVISKGSSNMIGISIGGGSPWCPCLYIVQIFDGTPASKEGSLQSGDELLAVNSASVKGKTKVEVAKMIQTAPNDVVIHYNKLHADPKQGKTLDIILKKLKHRIVDSMSANTADTLGLSRAILCNDILVKRLEELEGTEIMYKGLVEYAQRVLKAYYDLHQSYKSFGDCFTQISAREPQQRASETFRAFGELHRNLEKDASQIIKQINPILADLSTYLTKAIPDTKMTVRRYADAKFTFLSYCLKVKEMDDEEHGFAALKESLYRVETGNYEYRLILRCRQDARAKFAKLRTDVLEKMELLECKHATDLNKQLKSLLDKLASLHRSMLNRLESLPVLFPIEIDFKETDFQYKSSILIPQELDDSDNDATIARGLEASEENITHLGNEFMPTGPVDFLTEANEHIHQIEGELKDPPRASASFSPENCLPADLMAANSLQTDLLLQ